MERTAQSQVAHANERAEDDNRISITLLAKFEERPLKKWQDIVDSQSARLTSQKCTSKG